MTVHSSSPIAAPSAWVERWARQLPKDGHVLDVACGQGRHMRFLSALNFRMTGVDVSPLAQTSCANYGRFVLADLEQDPWPFTNQSFDAIVVTNYLFPPLFESIERSLRPGGSLIYETFAVGNESFGRPSNPQFLLKPLELVRGFPGLTVISYENGVIEPPTRYVQRLFAVKPNDGLQGPPQIRL